MVGKYGDLIFSYLVIKGESVDIVLTYTENLDMIIYVPNQTKTNLQMTCSLLSTGRDSIGT
jgi:hypothetical protein